jgi:hypothetical protein
VARAVYTRGAGARLTGELDAKIEQARRQAEP